VRAAVDTALTYTGATGTAPASVAPHITVSQGQVNLQGAPGSTKTIAETVTNAGDKPITVAPSLRRLQPVASTTQSLTLSGGTVTSTDVQAPAGDQIMVHVFNKNISTTSGHIALYDVHGSLANISLPQGNSGYSTLSVLPDPGNGSRYTLTFPAGLTGATTVRTDVYQNEPTGQVDTRLFTLAAHADKTVRVKVQIPADSGDTAAALAFTTSAAGSHDTSSVPVTLRSVLSLGSGKVNLSGTFTGGNGRSLYDEQRFVYAVDVPSGTPVLHAGFALHVPTGADADLIEGDLVAPNGQVADEANSSGFPFLLPGVELPGDYPPNFDLTSLAPAQGRWLLVLTEIGTAAGAAQDFSGSLSTASPVRVAAPALPTSASQVLLAGRPVTVPVTVTNSSASNLAIQQDARTARNETNQLTPTLAGTGTESPVQPIGGLFFAYGLPLGAKRLSVTSSAPVPTFLMLQSDPSLGTIATSDLKQAQDGNTIATATVTSDSTPLTPGTWDVSTSPLGPVTVPQDPGNTLLSGSAVMPGFDRSMTVADDDATSVGADPYLHFIDADVPWDPSVGHLLLPGETFTFNMVITPTGKPGKVVHGVLNILTDDGRTAVAAMPYACTVGRSS
jgi:hypothetical protein